MTEEKLLLLRRDVLREIDRLKPMPHEYIAHDDYVFAFNRWAQLRKRICYLHAERLKMSESEDEI